MVNERTIWSDAISFIKATPNLTGYEVIQSAQAQVINPNISMLVLDMVGAPHYSWQGSKDVVKPNGQIEHKEIWYQEYVFQLTALKKKSMLDTGLSQLDVLFMVSSYLNSEAGIQKMTKKGYGIYRITELRTGYYLNDNDVYERQPSFDFTLNRRQEISSFVPAISGIEASVNSI